jgi:hypothetical protein
MKASPRAIFQDQSLSYSKIVNKAADSVLTDAEEAAHLGIQSSQFC